MKLQTTIDNLGNDNIKMLMGDLNTMIGSG